MSSLTIPKKLLRGKRPQKASSALYVYYLLFINTWPQCIDQVQTKGATTTISSTASVFPSYLWQAGRPDWTPQALLSITFHVTVIGAWAGNGWKVGCSSITSGSPTGGNTRARYLPSCATRNFGGYRTGFYIARFHPSRRPSKSAPGQDGTIGTDHAAQHNLGIREKEGQTCVYTRSWTGCAGGRRPLGGSSRRRSRYTS